MNKVLIVSLLFNRQPFTKLFLENLFNYTLEPFDLLLWDNGSAYPTQKLLDKVEKLKFRNGSTVTIVRNSSNLGVASSLHKAQRYRKKDQHFMQLDSDVLVPKDNNWLNDLINIIENNNEGIQLAGYPQHPADVFYKEFSARWIALKNKNVQIYDTKNILGCCFIGHFSFYNNFEYQPSEKKYGTGSDMDVYSYATEHNVKMAYIRPVSMIDFFENMGIYCSESEEYHKWKLKMLHEKEYTSDFIPSRVSEDDSELNIKKELLCD
jgi:glycosyltransferase involved in cell wall biosynthesis